MDSETAFTFFQLCVHRDGIVLPVGLVLVNHETKKFRLEFISTKLARVWKSRLAHAQTLFDISSVLAWANTHDHLSYRIENIANLTLQTETEIFNDIANRNLSDWLRLSDMLDVIQSKKAQQRREGFALGEYREIIPRPLSYMLSPRRLIDWWNGTTGVVHGTNKEILKEARKSYHSFRLRRMFSSPQNVLEERLAGMVIEGALLSLAPLDVALLPLPYKMFVPVVCRTDYSTWLVGIPQKGKAACLPEADPGQAIASAQKVIQDWIYWERAALSWN